MQQVYGERAGSQVARGRRFSLRKAREMQELPLSELRLAFADPYGVLYLL